MSDLVQYGLARVKAILRPQKEYDGWKVNQRPPQIGDVGTITDILKAPSVPDRFVVEMSAPVTGKTVWLSDFEREELEPMAEKAANQTIQAIGAKRSSA